MVNLDGMLKEKKSALRELQEDIRALERVKHMSPNGTEGSLPAETNASVSFLEIRQKRTQKEAIDYIANQENGRVKVNVVKDLLIKAGKIKGNPRYAYGHIYNMLKNDDSYEPLGDGVFSKKGHDGLYEQGKR